MIFSKVFMDLIVDIAKGFCDLEKRFLNNYGFWLSRTFFIGIISYLYILLYWVSEDIVFVLFLLMTVLLVTLLTVCRRNLLYFEKVLQLFLVIRFIFSEINCWECVYAVLYISIAGGITFGLFMERFVIAFDYNILAVVVFLQSVVYILIRKSCLNESLAEEVLQWKRMEFCFWSLALGITIIYVILNYVETNLWNSMYGIVSVLIAFLRCIDNYKELSTMYFDIYVNNKKELTH